MDFLTKIISAKRLRFAATEKAVSLNQVGFLARQARASAEPRRFSRALRDTAKINIIAEFKRRSPSKGDINAGAEAAAFAKLYETAGAAAVSVLTEEDYF